MSRLAGNAWVWNLRDDPRKKLRSRRAGKWDGYLTAPEWLAAVHPEIDLSTKTEQATMSSTTEDLGHIDLVRPPDPDHGRE
jgi:hypothetical protein